MCHTWMVWVLYKPWGFRSVFGVPDRTPRLSVVFREIRMWVLGFYSTCHHQISPKKHHGFSSFFIMKLMKYPWVSAVDETSWWYFTGFMETSWFQQFFFGGSSISWICLFEGSTLLDVTFGYATYRKKVGRYQGKVRCIIYQPKFAGHFWEAFPTNQWIFQVPLKGGRWHIIPQLAVYTTYIPLIYCLLGGYIIPTTLYRNLKNPLN